MKTGKIHKNELSKKEMVNKPCIVGTMVSREKDFIKNTMILSIGTFFPKLTTFLITPILTGYLTKEEYGIYDLIVILSSLLLPAVTLQIQSAAFRFLVENRNDKDESKKIITNILIVQVPLSIIAVVATYFIIPIKDDAIKLAVCAFLFFDGLSGTIGQISRGLNKNIVFSIGATISAIGKLLFLLAFTGLFDFGLFGAVLSLAISNIMSALFIMRKIHVKDYIDVKLLDMRFVLRMLDYSWPMVPNAISMWIMRASDRLVITATIGIAQSATYAAANKIPSILTLFQNVFSMAWQENASLSVKDQDSSCYFSEMLKRMNYLLAGSMALILAICPVLFPILIRGDYSEAYKQVPILLFSMLYFGLASFLGGIYVAYKKTRSVGITTAISAIINLAIDVTLIRHIGLYAASGSTLISCLFLFTYRLIDLKKSALIQNSIIRAFIPHSPVLIQCILFYSHIQQRNIYILLIGTIAFLSLNRKMICVLFTKIRKFITGRYNE